MRARQGRPPLNTHQQRNAAAWHTHVCVPSALHTPHLRLACECAACFTRPLLASPPHALAETKVDACTQNMGVNVTPEMQVMQGEGCADSACIGLRHACEGGDMWGWGVATWPGAELVCKGAGREGRRRTALPAPRHPARSCQL